MSESMNENVIEFLRDSKTATVTFSQGRYVSKIKRLAESYPDECQIIHENEDGSILAHIPTKWINISKRTGREMTDEEKSANAERLKAYREQRRING